MEPIWNEVSIETVGGRAAAQLLVESDIPIPSGRTAQKIVMAQGKIRNDITRCTNGHIQTEGVITLQLLCVDLDNMPFGMRASTQYSHDIPLKDVKEGMRASVKPQLMDFNCSLKDQRIHINAVAELNALSEATQSIRVITDIKECGEIEKQYTQLEQGKLIQLSSNIIRIREELEAPNIENLLVADSSTLVKNVQIERDGIGVSGNMYVSALYCEEEGRMIHNTFPIPFDELMSAEMDIESIKSVFATAAVQDISVYVSDNPGYIMVEASLLICVNAVGLSVTNVVEDLYEVGGNKKAKCKRVEKLSPISHTAQSCTIHEGLRLPEGQPDAFKAIYTTARPTVLGVTDNEGQLNIEGLLITGVVYQTDEGMLLGFEEDVPFTCKLDAPYTPDGEVTAHLIEAKCSGSGRTLGCSYIIECECLVKEYTYASLAVEIEEGDLQKHENGIVINYAKAGETYWNIAKRFNVPVNQLRLWNENITEPFTEGCPLTIMCASGKRRA